MFGKTKSADISGNKSIATPKRPRVTVVILPNKSRLKMFWNHKEKRVFRTLNPCRFPQGELLDPSSKGSAFVSQGLGQGDNSMNPGFESSCIFLLQFSI